MAGSSTAEQPATDEQPAFFFDLASLESYVVAERILSALPVLAEWKPVDMPPPDEDHGAVTALAAEHGLMALRMPPAPSDSPAAMRAATYAKKIGRGVAFAQAAFRQAYAGGRDLGDPDTLVIAGAACEMHPAALLKGMNLRSVGTTLAETTAKARAAGVERVPAVQVGERVFHGDAGLAGAAAALGA